jgi:hypothetical protein
VPVHDVPPVGGSMQNELLVPQMSPLQQPPGAQAKQLPLQLPQLTPPLGQSSAVAGQLPPVQQAVPAGTQLRPQWCWPVGQSLEPMALFFEQQ